MKKYLKLLLLLIIFPVAIKAAEINVSLSCPEGAALNSEINCIISVDTQVKFTGLSGKYDLGESFSYISFTPKSDFVAYASSANGFAIGNTSGKSGKFEIGVLKVKLLKSGTLTIKSLDGSDIDDKSYDMDNLKLDIKVLSAINTLDSLSIVDHKLDQTFKSNTLNYTATIDADSITIEATLTDSKSKVSGTGKKELKVGINKFSIVVLSESGSKKTYTLTVTRPSKEDEEFITRLSAKGYNIKFEKAKSDYILKVGAKTSEVEIGATLASNKYSFVTSYGPRTVELKSDTTEALIKVKNQAGTIKTYKITIIKESSSLSSNANIKSIKIENYTFDFDNNISNYDLTIGNEDHLNFEVTLEDPKAKYEIIGNQNLTNGSQIVIRVTAEDGSINVFTLDVVKKETKDDTVCLNDDENRAINFLMGFGCGVLLMTLIFIAYICNKKGKEKQKETKQDIYKSNNNEEEFLYEGYPEYNVNNNYEQNNYSNYYNQNNN